MSLIAEGFVMNEVNTPTRVGELIGTIEEIYDIPTPRVGMLVYVKDEGKSYVVKTLKSKVVNGVEVPDAQVDGYELWDMKATEEELLKRIQGKSEESNPYTDGFKFIGHFTSVDDLSEALDNLKYNTSEKGLNRGYFRFTYALSQAEVVNYFLGLTKVIQVVRGIFSAEDGKIKLIDGVGVIVRSRDFNTAWSDWSVVIDSDTISNIENSIEDKVNSVIAGLLDTAPEDLDTLKEIADWIATHKEGAADMVANISKNTTDIANEITRAKAAEKALSDRIDNIPTGGGDVDLSGYVQNAVFNQALTNLNTIKPRFGVINPDGSVLSSNALRANIMLSDGCRLVVNDGYLIGRVVILKNGKAVDVWSDKLKLAELTIESGTQLTWLLDIYKKDNTEFSAAELDTVIKSLTFDSIRWDKYSNLNDYQGNGEYYIQGTRTRTAKDNMPILNEGDVEGTLKVIADSVSKTAVQILSLLNVGGGDGNIYTRTRQDNTWSAWGKLQTNVEVGIINQQQMDALVDNGIYSGILSTTKETFVIICINNYAIAQQVGVHHISHLKYSLVAGTAEVKIEKRTRDAYGFWTEWQGIGGGSSYTLPVATDTTLGGIKSNSTYGLLISTPFGEEFALNVMNRGIASVTIPRADEGNEYGVVKVDSSVNPESNNPVSGKGVADAIATAITNTINTPV